MHAYCDLRKIHMKIHILLKSGVPRRRGQPPNLLSISWFESIAHDWVQCQSRFLADKCLPNIRYLCRRYWTSESQLPISCIPSGTQMPQLRQLIQHLQLADKLNSPSVFLFSMLSGLLSNADECIFINIFKVSSMGFERLTKK